MNIKEYADAKSDEEKVIEAVNNRFNKPGKHWIIEQTTFREDMLGIDAKGVIRTNTKGDIKILIQIKNMSFHKLPALKKKLYLKKVSANMDKIDPDASQRLLCYYISKDGNITRFYNYNLKKKIEEL